MSGADGIVALMLSGRRTAIRALMVMFFGAAVVIAAIAIWAALGKKTIRVSMCRVTVGSSQYVIDLDQAANATTITAVGKRLDMPDHAVTVALATALQESQLHNIDYGDRDSLGLFQQRPSQGWGTAAQVMNPRYAAAAFFKALARVPGWQTMPVTDAAQAVQHSNAPQAYALWSLDSPVSSARGWTIASWLVGHADQYRITSVHFAGLQWTPRGLWAPTATNATRVQITQTPARRK
jgi:hypothetical protein